MDTFETRTFKRQLHFDNKYDLTEEALKEFWRDFLDSVECTVNQLKNLPVALQMMGSEEFASTMLSCIAMMADALVEMAKTIDGLAPLFWKYEDDLRYIKHRLSEASHLLDNTPFAMKTDLRTLMSLPVKAVYRTTGQCKPFNVATELAQMEASNFYKGRTHGILKFITSTKTALKAEMIRRGEWASLVENCDVALDDERLQQHCEDVMRNDGRENFRHLLVVAIILNAHRQSRHRFTPEEVAEAIDSTMRHLSKLETQELLGVWFTWRHLEDNARALQRDFRVLVPKDLIDKHKLGMGASSQFCRRASDPYLLTTAPQDWDFVEWAGDGIHQGRGKQGVGKSHEYLRRMKAAAELFLHTLYNR